MHQFWLKMSLEETFFVWIADWGEIWKWQDCWELKKTSISLAESFFCICLFSQLQAPRNSFFRSQMSPVSSVCSCNKQTLFLQWVWVVMSQHACHREQPEKSRLCLKAVFFLHISIQVLNVSDKNTCKQKEVYFVLPLPLDVFRSICLYGRDCIKLVAQFPVLILSSLTVTLVLTFPPEFFPATCCRLLVLFHVVGNYYQVFQQIKIAANMFSSYFLFLPSVSISLCSESVWPYPGKLHIFSWPLGSIFYPQIETGSPLPVVLARELTVSSCEILDLDRAVL